MSTRSSLWAEWSPPFPHVIFSSCLGSGEVSGEAIRTLFEGICSAAGGRFGRSFLDAEGGAGSERAVPRKQGQAAVTGRMNVTCQTTGANCSNSMPHCCSVHTPASPWRCAILSCGNVSNCVKGQILRVKHSIRGALYRLCGRRRCTWHRTASQ